MQLKNSASGGKVTIIGAGQVGSTTAYSLIAGNTCEEIAIIDLNQKMAKAQVMDLQHSTPLWGFTKVKLGSYDDVADSKIVIICAGAAQNVGMSRLALVKTNSAVIKEIMPKIFRANPKAIVILISNPVDILTYLAIKQFPAKKNQIFGSGTTLDSTRFKLLIGHELKVSPESIHAYIVGEHGDSEVALWSTADVGSAPIDQFKKISAAKKQKIFTTARNAAYAIIEGKQFTNFGIAAVVNKMVRAVLEDKKTVFPVSHLLTGEYGISGVALSLPAVIGSTGIVKKITPKISQSELARLKKSAVGLKKIIGQL